MLLRRRRTIIVRGGEEVKTEIHPTVFVVAILVIIAVVFFVYQRYSRPPVLSPSEAERIRKALKYETLQPQASSSQSQPNRALYVPPPSVPSR